MFEMLKLLIFLCSALSISECVKNRNKTYRIVGGHVVDIELHPYQVSVRELNEHICGGSIITNRWVLTAGHCVDDTIAAYMNVRVGSAFYAKGGTIHPVDSVTTHPDHVPYSWLADFALLHLKHAIVFSTIAQPIALAFRLDNALSDRECVVTGWGRTLNEEESFDKLRAVQIPLVSRVLCNATYEGKIDQTMICAGDFVDGGKGSCAYDSGGPLVCGDMQVGIVSWGKGCAMPGYPDVYSSVLYARAWINSIVHNSIE
ncbi:trypsin-4-like [Anopheles arabiensis]|uniref:Peptidase S1 domain-containing protein n=1 Tax=Anopheles arabiensis TaxID=7173 RepID=A0A8W7MU02_ANOAR|nr:trypsin-4-like [Anopheles arabiensis]